VALGSDKIESQTTACIHAVRTVLAASLVEREPADRRLARYFRHKRSLGARDRRLIYDVVFAVLRWWGWVRFIGPPYMRDVLAQTCRPPHEKSLERALFVLEEVVRKDWLRILLASSLFEGLSYPDVQEHWAAGLGLDLSGRAVPSPDAPLRELCSRVFELVQSPRPAPRYPLEALVPSWHLRYYRIPAPVQEVAPYFIRRPPVWLRARRGAESQVPAALDAAGVRAERHPVLPEAIRVDDPHVNVPNLDIYRRGLVEIQDLGSQAVCAVCGVRPRETWWAACAGAGGKALCIADKVGSKGAVLAGDQRADALRRLRDRAARARLRNIRTTRMDAREPRLRRGASFDGVLVDVPCSGSGTWARNPDARWRLCPSDLERMPELQYDILAGAAPHVRSGGVLVYATCSVFSVENEQVIMRFLHGAPDYRLDTFPHPLYPERTMTGWVYIWPWDGPCNGMFIARLRRG